MYWYLLKEFKEEISAKKLFKAIYENIKKKQKIEIVVELFLAILIFVINIIYNFKIFLLLLLIGVCIIIYFRIIKILYEIRIKVFGSNEEIHKKYKVDPIRKILKERNIYNKNKIEILISQIDRQLPEHNITKYLFNPFKKFFSSWFIPFVLVYLGWVFKIFENGKIKIVIERVLLVSFVLFGFYYIFIPILGDLINKNYRKMKQLKMILQDILILDFDK